MRRRQASLGRSPRTCSAAAPPKCRATANFTRNIIVDGLKAQKIGIISGREEYPKNEGDALTKQLQKWYEITPVKRVEFNIGDKDFTPQLLEMQEANPQVIAFFGNPAEAAIAMRQAKELGLNQPFFVGTTMVDQGLLTAAGPAAEGASGFALIPLLPVRAIRR